MGEADYVNMSLEDVIRDMKARKIAGFGEEMEDNSPFMRQQNRVPFKTKQTPFWPKKPALKSYNQGDRSNYLSHMAKKRVQHAHRTLDLRRKLIHQRTNREGLDLRWKIVANTIARMRAQLRNNGQTAHRFNPYPPMARSASCRNHLVPLPRFSRAALSRIERLVGKLPAWVLPQNVEMTPNSVMVRQPQPYHHHHHGVGHHQLDIGISPSNAIVPCFGHHLQSTCCTMTSSCSSVNRQPPPLVHAPPPSRLAHRCHSAHCHGAGGVVHGVENIAVGSCQQSKHFVDDSRPPPLAYEPPPNRRSASVSDFANSASTAQPTEDVIETIVVDEPGTQQSQDHVPFATNTTMNERIATRNGFENAMGY